MNGRFLEIDIFRGLAVIMMIFFHFLWDLNYFGFTSFSLYTDGFGLFQNATAGLFLFLVGITTAISFSKYGKNFFEKSLRRSTRIFLYALLVTLFTFIFFREQFVFFGVLHLIATASLLSIPLAGKKIENILLGGFFILTPIFFDLRSIGIVKLAWLGFSAPLPTLDFFPVFPWFGLILLGIAFGNYFYVKKEPKEKTQNELTKILVFFGRNSLFIYFIHQPILFALIFLFSIII